MGDVKGKDVYIVDDMICTGGTLVKALEETKNMGAKKVVAVCTHALFNGPAWERFHEAYEKGFLDMVIGTDSTYHSKEFLKKSPWFKVNNEEEREFLEDVIIDNKQVVADGGHVGPSATGSVIVNEAPPH